MKELIYLARSSETETPPQIIIGWVDRATMQTQPPPEAIFSETTFKDFIDQFIDHRKTHPDLILALVLTCIDDLISAELAPFSRLLNESNISIYLFLQLQEQPPEQTEISDFSALQGCTFISELNIQLPGVEFLTYFPCLQIGQILRGNKIQALEIGGHEDLCPKLNNLTPEFTDALAQNSSLQKIKIGTTFMGANSLEQLALAIGQHRGIRELDFVLWLDRNAAQDEKYRGIEAFFTQLKSQFTGRLSLTPERFDDQAYAIFAAGLAELSIEELNLDSLVDLKRLSLSTLLSNTRLRRLTSDSSANVDLAPLQGDTSSGLKEFGFYYRPASEQEHQKILRLVSTTYVKKLNLRDAPLIDHRKYLPLLADALDQNPSLLSLGPTIERLCSQELHTEAAQRILTKLKTNMARAYKAEHTYCQQLTTLMLIHRFPGAAASGSANAFSWLPIEVLTSKIFSHWRSPGLYQSDFELFQGITGEEQEQRRIAFLETHLFVGLLHYLDRLNRTLPNHLPGMFKASLKADLHTAASIFAGIIAIIKENSDNDEVAFLVAVYVKNRVNDLQSIDSKRRFTDVADRLADKSTLKNTRELLEHCLAPCSLAIDAIRRRDERIPAYLQILVTLLEDMKVREPEHGLPTRCIMS